MLNSFKIIFLTNRNYILIIPLIILFLFIAGILELLGISTFIVFIGSFFNSQIGSGSNQIIILVNEYLNYFKIDKKLIPIFACSLIISGSLVLIIINLITQTFIANIEKGISFKIFYSLVYDESNKFLDNKLKKGADQVIVNDIYAFSAVLISLFQIFSKSILIIFFSIYVYFSLKTNIGFSVLIITIVSITIFFLLYNKTRKLGSEMHKKTFELFSYLKNLSGMSKLLSLYSNKNELTKNYKLIVSSISNSRKINSFLANSNKKFMEIFLLIILLFYFYFYKNINIESLLVIGIVAIRLFPYFNSVQVSLNQLNMYRDYSDNILKYLLADKTEDENLNNLKVAKGFNKLEYNINNFQYPNNGFLFKSKNIIFEVGKKYLIKGSNSKGKTTLLNFISLNIFFEGSISTIIGSLKVNVENLTKFRKKYISFSPQSDNFIEGKVQENINLFSNNTNFIKNYKSVLKHFEIDSIINKNVHELSGGKLKLLSIVRALVFDRKIIILDEPFNNLDVLNSKKLETFLQSSFFKDKVLIITNHNKSKINQKFININI